MPRDGGGGGCGHAAMATAACSGGAACMGNIGAADIDNLPPTAANDLILPQEEAKTRGEAEGTGRAMSQKGDGNGARAIATGQWWP